MNFTIKNLRHLIAKEYDFIPKSLGVELVELGFLKYKKLTAENYHYWWYEVVDSKKIDKKAYTYNWSDLVFTQKADLIFQFIRFYKDQESIYNLITALLNIESARFDGVCKHTGIKEYDRLINFYYSSKMKIVKQLELCLNCA